MNEKSYKKRLDFQQSMISRQLKQIEDLKLQNENLKLECKKKDEIINSIAPLREELAKNVEKVKKHKKELKELINELRKMKDIINRTVYKGRWWLIKILLR